MKVELELPQGVSAEDASLLLAIKLWETGRLSMGQAASLAGYSRPAFMEILGKYGVPVFNYSPDDFDREYRLWEES